MLRVNRHAYLLHTTKDPFCGFEINEELLWLTTQEWTRRGEKVNVWIGDVPLPEGVKTPWVEALSALTTYGGIYFASFGRLWKMLSTRRVGGGERDGNCG